MPNAQLDQFAHGLMWKMAPKALSDEKPQKVEGRRKNHARQKAKLRIMKRGR
jgi:hypothetical protein